MAYEYVGDKPLPILESEAWPATLAGGDFQVLNELYNSFLSRQNMRVQLCFKRLGIYSFGGFGASADTEGNAALFDNEGGEPDFNKHTAKFDLIANGLGQFMMIPINPEEITVNYQINTNSYDTIFFAELATITGIKLRKFTIRSFFPYRSAVVTQFGTEPIFSPKNYIDWITECMDNKMILAFKAFGELAQPLPFMKCFIESFDTTLKANGDVEYVLNICEYIDYRKNIDTRKFVMDGNMLVVSSKKKRREGGEIFIGDFVKVADGIVFNDELKQSRFGLSDVQSNVLRTPPAAMLSRLAIKDNPFNDEQIGYTQQQIGMGFLFTMFSPSTLMMVYELIKAFRNVDRNEIWMVVAIHSDELNAPKIGQSLHMNIAQMNNYLNDLVDFSYISLKKNVQLRSMKDGRHGWVSMSQLVKYDFAQDGLDFNFFNET